MHYIAFLRPCGKCMYDDVNDLISSVKAIFKKVPRRIALYHEKCSLPLPPNPVVTRWGTWLEAVSFYANHFDEIKHVIEDLCRSF